MTAIAIGLMVLLAGAGVLIYSTIRRGDKRTDERLAEADQLATSRDQVAAKTLEAERSKFELGNANNALATERTRAKALEDYVASIATSDPNGDLAPDDVAGRLARLSRQLGAAAEAAHPTPGSPVRADSESPVSAKPGAAEGKAAGADDLLRPE